MPSEHLPPATGNELDGETCGTRAGPEPAGAVGVAGNREGRCGPDDKCGCSRRALRGDNVAGACGPEVGNAWVNCVRARPVPRRGDKDSSPYSTHMYLYTIVYHTDIISVAFLDQGNETTVAGDFIKEVKQR